MLCYYCYTEASIWNVFPVVHTDLDSFMNQLLMNNLYWNYCPGPGLQPSRCSLCLYSALSQQRLWSLHHRTFRKKKQHALVVACMLVAFPLETNYFTWQALHNRCCLLFWFIYLISLTLQMGMSPSRMPQTQGIMGSHANNMVSQPANQGQFLQQGQFPVSAGGAMNVNIGLGPAMSQASVTQVRKMLCFFS